MGDDTAIVQAARVSYGAGTKHVSDDRNLIRYLMRHKHTTPFEMVEFKFHVRVPMDALRQWIRHRMASVNEYSIATALRSMRSRPRRLMPGAHRRRTTSRVLGGHSNIRQGAKRPSHCSHSLFGLLSPRVMCGTNTTYRDAGSGTR
jgi:thymidylate synthase (FAD)